MRSRQHVSTPRQWLQVAIATGLIAGLAAVSESPRAFPRETALGSLCAYVSGADPANYQPANITFDLLPKLEHPPKDRKLRHAEVCRRARAALEEHLKDVEVLH